MRDTSRWTWDCACVQLSRHQPFCSARSSHYACWSHSLSSACTNRPGCHGRSLRRTLSQVWQGRLNREKHGEDRHQGQERISSNQTSSHQLGRGCWCTAAQHSVHRAWCQCEGSSWGISPFPSMRLRVSRWRQVSFFKALHRSLNQR